MSGPTKLCDIIHVCKAFNVSYWNATSALDLMHMLPRERTVSNDIENFGFCNEFLNQVQKKMLLALLLYLSKFYINSTKLTSCFISNVQQRDAKQKKASCNNYLCEPHLLSQADLEQILDISKIRRHFIRHKVTMKFWPIENKWNLSLSYVAMKLQGLVIREYLF